MSPTQRHPGRGYPAFSLVEMMAVIAVLVILLAAGLNRISNSASHAVKTNADLLAALIDQARTTAITSHSCVLLAIAEPADLPTRDPRCHLAIFKLHDEAPDLTANPKAVMAGRWHPLDANIALLGGNADDNGNPMDAAKLTMISDSPLQSTVKVHAIAFNPSGRLIYPPGAAPVTLRVAECVYQHGDAKPIRRNPATNDIRLKIGRVSARTYRIDP